jgi:hypothetical protein
MKSDLKFEISDFKAGCDQEVEVGSSKSSRPRPMPQL